MLKKAVEVWKLAGRQRELLSKSHKQILSLLFVSDLIDNCASALTMTS